VCVSKQRSKGVWTTTCRRHSYRAENLSWCALLSCVCVCESKSERVCVEDEKERERLIFCQAFPNKNTSFLITSALSASASAVAGKSRSAAFRAMEGSKSDSLLFIIRRGRESLGRAWKKNAQNSAARAINLISTFALLHLFSHTH
jgi:hypothetical protein